MNNSIIFFYLKRENQVSGSQWEIQGGGLLGLHKFGCRQSLTINSNEVLSGMPFFQVYTGQNKKVNRQKTSFFDLFFTKYVTGVGPAVLPRVKKGLLDPNTKVKRGEGHHQCNQSFYCSCRVFILISTGKPQSAADLRLWNLTE